ncbi:uncharacterized protein LOC114307879 [Camellia sinensis]|uniref:uncharacterized protein LOC114307879 n=1 Tax=Camellia sinensis TaxID=4442 RepID=UPI00103693A0|nr:uncharacterized protein LOC114307879 [Camellia sinensis]
MGIKDIPPSTHTPQTEKTKDKGLALPTVPEEQTGNNNQTPESVKHRLPFAGVFPSSLGEIELRWFDRLPAGSIRSWKQLSEEFLAKFVSNTKIPKEQDTLFGLRKEQEETLRHYARRYWEEYNDLEENVCSEQMAVMSFKHGLRPKSKLRQSLTKRPTTALKDLRARIEQYARLEDDQIPIEVASAEQTAWHKKRTDRGKHRGIAVNEVDKSKSHEAVVTLGAIKSSDAPTTKTGGTYHQDRALKQHLEDLVVAGHLRDYIDQDKEVTEPGNPLPEPNIEHPPRLILNVIDGTATKEPEETLREEIAKAMQIQQVMSVGPASKKVRAVSKSPLCTVSFTRKDLEGIQHPHTDALIITVGIGKRFDVKRVLVDQGSAADILYYDLFRKLGLSEQHLTPAVAPYHQEKTAFITPRGTYCYRVMLFGLKNAETTYQRMVTRMFKDQLGKTMEAYIDDMVVKSKFTTDHLTDLRKFLAS